ncbi:hypothetical protein ACG904_09575 [Acinetobacter guillouiae]|uniref:hypothetical protein n=1 Tax=Acinetobacter guillouiae TaxID=106649 RepID=UPI003AF74073
MNAVELVIKFIQRQGFDGAKDIIQSAHTDMTHVTNDGRMFVNCEVPGFGNEIINQLKDLVLISDIKRLVESWELVNKHGGIDHAKTYSCRVLEQAIVDVESVGGGV